MIHSVAGYVSYNLYQPSLLIPLKLTPLKTWTKEYYSTVDQDYIYTIIVVIELLLCSINIMIEVVLKV